MSNDSMMSFPAALQCVIDGMAITKREWNDEQFFVELRDMKLMIHKPDGLYYPLIVSDGDMRGTDWVIKK